MRQQPVQPPRILEGRLREILDASLEILAVGVHRPDHDLVAEHEGEIDPVGGHLDLVIAARDARQHEHSVLRQRLHRVEHQRCEPGSLEDQIEGPMLRRDVEERTLLRGRVAGTQPLDEIRVEIRTALPSERRDVEPPQPQRERREQPDRARSDDGRLLRPPHAEPALDLERLCDPLFDHRCRLEQYTYVAQALRHLDQELGILDIVLGQEPVPPADPALEVHVVGRHVGCADAVVDAHPGPAHRGDHIVAHHELRHPRANLLHDAETLVAQRQKRAAFGGLAVLGGVDFLVGAVDADPQDPDEDAPFPRDVGHGRHGELREVHRSRLAREDGDRFHHDSGAAFPGGRLACAGRGESRGHDDVSARVVNGVSSGR